jgi:hypothetical protein
MALAAIATLLYTQNPMERSLPLIRYERYDIIRCNMWVVRIVMVRIVMVRIVVVRIVMVRIVMVRIVMRIMMG